MRQQADNDPRLEVRKSYAGYLVRYLRWRLANAQPGPVPGLT
jgi:hypothetical protein